MKDTRSVADWLDALAGRDPRPDADPKAVMDGRIIRKALLRSRDGSVPQDAELEEIARRAIAAANAHEAAQGREDNLVPIRSPQQPAPSAPAGVGARAHFGRGGHWALAACLVLAVGIGVSVWLDPGASRGTGDQIGEGERGGEVPTEYLQAVADPRDAAERAAAALRTLGIEPRVYSVSGLWVVDAQIPDSARANAAAALGTDDVAAGNVRFTFRKL